MTKLPNVLKPQIIFVGDALGEARRSGAGHCADVRACSVEVQR